jgi:hypothetical protein
MSLVLLAAGLGGFLATCGDAQPVAIRVYEVTLPTGEPFFGQFSP